MVSGHPVDFVFFDAGYTLIYPHPSVGFHYAGASRRYGVEVAASELDEAFADAWKATRAVYEARRPVPYGRTELESLEFWSEVVRRTFLVAGYAPPGDPDYYREVFRLFERASCWKPYEDTEEGLGLLDRAGIPYGILSNWDARLHSVVGELGWRGRLAAVVLSGEVGAEKPARAIFEAAATVVHVPPSRIALIGDDPEADAQGPRDAGWRYCLVRRDSVSPPPPLDDLIWAPTLPGAVERILWGGEIERTQRTKRT